MFHLQKGIISGFLSNLTFARYEDDQGKMK